MVLHTTFWEFHLWIRCVPTINYHFPRFIAVLAAQQIPGVDCYSSVFQVLVEKRKARNPFRRTAPYMLSCDLAFQLESALAVSILRSMESSLYPGFFYRTSHLLIKLAGGLEYSWSIPFFRVIFRFSQPDEESLIFSQRGLQNFWARLIFFAGQVRISRAYWNGVFDLIPGISWNTMTKIRQSIFWVTTSIIINLYVNSSTFSVMRFSQAGGTSTCYITLDKASRWWYWIFCGHQFWNKGPWGRCFLSFPWLGYSWYMLVHLSVVADHAYTKNHMIYVTHTIHVMYGIFTYIWLIFMV